MKKSLSLLVLLGISAAACFVAGAHTKRYIPIAGFSSMSISTPTKVLRKRAI